MRTRHSGLRAGFTLIEVLVTLLLLALLVAVTFPVITQQMDQGDPAKAANDLANIRTGIEMFHLNVRPVYPGDLEDLVFAVSTAGDADINGNAYSSGQANRWNGPYVDATTTEAGAASGAVIETGFGGDIDLDFALYDLENDCPEGGTAANGCTADFDATNRLFLALQVNNLDGTTEAPEINDLIDGESETTPSAQGKLRWNDYVVNGTTVVYYLAVPIS